MNRTAKILLVILVAFVLASLAIYRLRATATKPIPRRSESTIRAATKTVEGQIDAVDPDTGTFTMNDGTEKVRLAFDERTEIVVAGKAVEPAAITTGASATVRYTQRRGRNLARRIELVAGAPPDSN